MSCHKLITIIDITHLEFEKAIPTLADAAKPNNVKPVQPKPAQPKTPTEQTKPVQPKVEKVKPTVTTTSKVDKTLTKVVNLHNKRSN